MGAGEDLEVPEDFKHVIQGDSVPINVTFGANDETERVTVDCHGCPLWERIVEWDEDKANCEVTQASVGTGGAQESRRVCVISFPEGFQRSGGSGFATDAGEPAHPAEYEVHMGDVGERGEEAIDTFEAHLSSASTCRPSSGSATGIAQRSDILMLSTSGHPQGQDVTIKVRDGQDVFFERQFRSQGESIAYHFRWEVPLDLPIGGDEREAEITVDAPTGSERESILLRPGVAVPVGVLEPGSFGVAESFNRTEEVEIGVFYQFFSAPRGCKDMAFDRELTPVTAEQYGEEPPNVLVRRLNAPPDPQPVEIVDNAPSRFDPTTSLLRVNYTINKDEEVSGEQPDPVYDIRFEPFELTDGNRIAEYNTTDYEVHPYDIVPEFDLLQDEVERLQTAQLVMNLTYADGSPFTPNDTDDPLDVHLGPAGEESIIEFEANHRREGIWNVSHDLGFEYEPLGAYTWRIQELQDENGRPGEENRVEHTITDVVDVLSARPILNLTTIVDGERVNETERTQRVHVRVEAHFRNGKPLTNENIDPSLGGIVLNVNKRNQFDRLVDQDRLVMTHADRPGTWIESFRIGRSPSTAPAGTWNLAFEARDDRSPPNENFTGFPFQVNPANISVAATDSPPALVDGGTVSFGFRLQYPDGSLVSEELVDEGRGGDLTVRLERVTRAGQPAIVERTLEPRSRAGGQAWELELDSEKITPGNHFFNVTGQDIHDNAIGPRASDLFTVLFNGEFRNSTTPICPEQDPTFGTDCEKERGETVYVTFPGASGDKGMTGETPEIRVHRQDPESGRWILFRSDVWMSPGEFFNETGRQVGNNHVGRFTTDRSTPTDTYRLVILGRGSDDRGFAGFTQEFNVTRVSVDREIIDPFPDSAKKTQEVSARIESRAGDVIDTTIAEAGPVRIRNIEVDTIGVGTFLRWRPPSSLPTGPASIEIEGRDLFGNPFSVEFEPIRLEPVSIEVDVDGSIPATAPRGERFSFDARMTYETGASFDRSDGTPDVIVRDQAGNQVDTGDAEERVNRWEIIWVPRADLPPGEYTLEVTGTDSAGNVIRKFTTQPIEVVAGTVEGTIDQQPPRSVIRGEAAEATISYPTQIEQMNATVTTGTDAIGEPEMMIDGSTVRLRFATDRQTTAADVRFELEGRDHVGNNLTAQTNRFAVVQQRLSIDWLDEPPRDVRTGQTVSARFVVQYEDGSLMRPGEGTPIVGLFAVDRPLGPVEAEPMEEQPAVWEVSWEPPDDVRTDIPYHFSASARDRFQNEASPTASRGFFVQNPIVPDYMPAPGPSPALVLAMLAALAAAARGLSQRREEQP